MPFAHIRRAAPARALALASALALTAATAAAAAAAAEPPKDTLMPEDAEARAFQEAYGFSDAVVHEGTMYLSGVVAGPAPGEDSLEPGYTRAFERIDAILKRLGASWDDVLVFDTFHKGSVSAQVEALLPVKNRYIKAPYPTWTAVGVSDLYDPGAVTEIRLVVRRRGGPPLQMTGTMRSIVEGHARRSPRAKTAPPSPLPTGRGWRWGLDVS